MIYSICVVVMFLGFFTAEVIICSRVKKLEEKLDRMEDMIIKNAGATAELSDRVDGLEDYVKMIRSETENDKHKDYWQSVMDYNPFIEKEGEK